MNDDLTASLAQYGREVRRRRIPIEMGEVTTGHTHHGSSDSEHRFEGDVMALDLETRTNGTPGTGGSPPRRWIGYAVLAAAAVLVLVVSLAVFGDGDEGSVDVSNDPAPAEPEPGGEVPVPEPEQPTEEVGQLPGPDATSYEVAQAYAEAVTAQDVDAIMALFADDGGMSNHPLGFVGTSAQIFAIHSQRAEAGFVVALDVSDPEPRGQTVVLSQEWTNQAGERLCSDGNRVRAEEGRIVAWQWIVGEPCPE